jgi:hypothetical protein
VSVKRVLIVIGIVVIVLAFLLHRQRQASRGLDIEPHAAKEIEKAKRQ